ILEANYPFATIQPNIAMIEVPDERLEHIANFFMFWLFSLLCMILNNVFWPLCLRMHLNDLKSYASFTSMYIYVF
ncbi:MAG: hypothetical protein Q8830_03275, partial [Candidatus Phytoplasma australasiaticum]|nr:hypothetical protein [Candidatus Phytoplasma australasiaticum]